MANADERSRFAREFAALLPASELDAWKPPTHPDFIKAYGEAYIRAVTEGAENPSDHDVLWALDEWLLSVDNEDIPRTVVVMLGIELLAVFVRNAAIPRDTLSVDVGVRTVADNRGSLSTKQRALVQLEVDRIARSSVFGDEEATAIRGLLQTMRE